MKIDEATGETLTKAAIEQSSSMLKGAIGITPYEAVETAGMAYGAIVGGVEALAEAPAIAIKLTEQIIEDVSVHAAKKLEKAMLEILMPPKLNDITGKAKKEVSKFLKSAGDIMKEILSDSEKQNYDDALKKQQEAIEENAKQQKEKAFKLKNKVQNIVGEVQEQCVNLGKYITQGKEWAEENANEIEEKAIEQIDKIIDEQVAKILKDKQDFIDSMAEGLAKRTADVANKIIEKLTKEKIDKINAQKQKIINKVKAQIGCALLNLMATLGL